MKRLGLYGTNIKHSEMMINLRIPRLSIAYFHRDVLQEALLLIIPTKWSLTLSRHNFCINLHSLRQIIVSLFIVKSRNTEIVYCVEVRNTEII